MKPILEKPLSKEQLICISTLVSKLNIDKEVKAYMVEGFSNGRCTSTKELFTDEALMMIKHLKSLDKDEVVAEKMRRKIISMAHELGWYFPSPPGEGLGVRQKVDVQRIDQWCLKYGYIKKKLDSYTKNELPKLITQFENGPYKHYITNL